MTIVILCLVYIVVGVWGWLRCTRQGTTRAFLVYFTVQIALNTAIHVVGQGAGFLPITMFPLVGQSVIALAWRGTVAVCALLVLTFVFTGAWLYNWRDATQGTITLTPGLLFVVVITRIALRAEQAREEIERLAGELQVANRQLGAYATQAEELATIRERNRLAREIHDSLGHYLTAINIQLEAARAVIEQDRPRAVAALGKAQVLTKDGLAEVRRSVAALRIPVTETRPLPESIASLVEESRTSGISTDLVVAGTPRRLAPEAEGTLYRAAQEALTNTRKHAQATHARLTLDYRPVVSVRLVIEDDGVGATHTDGGFGLVGVRERAHQLGGTLQIQTGSGQGFLLGLEVPG